jgi:hypothetical protein
MHTHPRRSSRQRPPQRAPSLKPCGVGSVASVVHSKGVHGRWQLEFLRFDWSDETSPSGQSRHSNRGEKKKKRTKKKDNPAWRHGPWASCSRGFCSKEQEDLGGVDQCASSRQAHHGHDEAFSAVEDSVEAGGSIHLSGSVSSRRKNKLTSSP